MLVHWALFDGYKVSFDESRGKIVRAQIESRYGLVATLRGRDAVALYNRIRRVERIADDDAREREGSKILSSYDY